MDKPILFAMNYKGFYALQSLIEKGMAESIEAVVSGKDESVEDDYFNRICELCTRHNIDFFERTAFPDDQVPVAFAIGWRWLIRNVDQLIVFHDSLLPRYRGFNPLVSALINGDNEVGATALLASEEYDRGAIIAQKIMKVEYPIKIQPAIERISILYGELLVELLEKVQNGVELTSTLQDETRASYSLWRDEEDYRIDWSQSAEKIRRTVDATGFPYKGSSAILGGELVRILEVEERPDVKVENRAIGKVIFMEEEKPVVVCGEGLLKIKEAVDSHKNSVLPLKGFRKRFQ